MQAGLRTPSAALGLLLAVGLLADAASATASVKPLSPGAFVRFLAEQPINKSLPKGFLPQGKAFGYVRGPIAQGRPQPPPHAVGVVEVGIKAACCPAGITYTVYPSAAIAHAWLLGDGPKPTFSIWRLKQLSSSSLPHPRLSGTVPGHGHSVIVESAGHAHRHPRPDRDGRPSGKRHRERHDLLAHEHPARQPSWRAVTDRCGSRSSSLGSTRSTDELARRSS